MSLAFLPGALEQGLLWGPMVLGVYLTFRVLDFPDLTVDSCFTLGAATTARLILLDYNPLVATLIALVIGALAGLITGLLHTKLKIAPLLAGILTMIGLYSINLRVMGAANLSLLRIDTLITWIEDTGIGDELATVALGLVICLFILAFVYFFLQTELGLAVRATGDNEQMIRSLGINTNTTKVIGLALGNALCALSGALVAQYQSYADIGMGIGMIIVGLASVIIGETLIGSRGLLQALIAATVGSVIYRVIIAAVLQMGLPSTDLKILTALIVTLALAFPIMRGRFTGISSFTKRGEGRAEHQ